MTNDWQYTKTIYLQYYEVIY